MKLNRWFLVSLAVCAVCAGCNALGGEFVMHPQPVNRRETGRAFLVSTQAEDRGYGLYSYLLLGEVAASEVMRLKYTAALKAFLRLPRIEAYAKYRRNWQLNVTYLPLTEPPPSEIVALASGVDSTDARVDAAVTWLLEHYDYPRARILASTLRGDYLMGPYIVSSLRPLGTKRLGEDENFLAIDMSTSDPALVPLWMSEFLKCSSRAEFWNTDRLTVFLIDVRSALEEVSKPWPTIVSTLKELVAIVKPGERASEPRAEASTSPARRGAQLR